MHLNNIDQQNRNGSSEPKFVKENYEEHTTFLKYQIHFRVSSFHDNEQAETFLMKNMQARMDGGGRSFQDELHTLSTLPVWN